MIRENGGVADHKPVPNTGAEYTVRPGSSLGAGSTGELGGSSLNLQPQKKVLSGLEGSGITPAMRYTTVSEPASASGGKGTTQEMQGTAKNDGASAIDRTLQGKSASESGEKGARKTRADVPSDTESPQTVRRKISEDTGDKKIIVTGRDETARDGKRDEGVESDSEIPTRTPSEWQTAAPDTHTTNESAESSSDIHRTESVDTAPEGDQSRNATPGPEASEATSKVTPGAEGDDQKDNSSVSDTPPVTGESGTDTIPPSEANSEGEGEGLPKKPVTLFLTSEDGDQAWQREQFGESLREVLAAHPDEGILVVTENSGTGPFRRLARIVNDEALTSGHSGKVYFTNEGESEEVQALREEGRKEIAGRGLQFGSSTMPWQVFSYQRELTRAELNTDAQVGVQRSRDSAGMIADYLGRDDVGAAVVMRRLSEEDLGDMLEADGHPVDFVFPGGEERGGMRHPLLELQRTLRGGGEITDTQIKEVDKAEHSVNNDPRNFGRAYWYDSGIQKLIGRRVVYRGEDASVKEHEKIDRMHRSIARQQARAERWDGIKSKVKSWIRPAREE